MKNDTNTYRLNPNSISQLFKLCEQPDEAEPASQPDYERMRHLRDLLADVPPLNGNALTGVPDILRHLHHTLPRMFGRSVRQILHDPLTSVAELRSVKDHAKILVSKAQTESEHEAAGIIYYAAIAHALVRHDIRITRHSYRQLVDSFAALLTGEWIPQDLKDLFGQARTVCTRHGIEDQDSAQDSDTV